MRATADRRILRVITRLNVGGPARQALLLNRELRNWETHLLAGRPTAAEGEFSDPAVPVRYVPLVRPLRPAQDLAALRAVRAALSEVRPSIMHTHMAKAGTVGRLAALTAHHRPRTVHTFHGHVLDGYFRAPVERAFLAAERFLAPRTDMLIAISPEIRDELLELGIGTREQFRVVPLGFELEAHLRVTGRSGALRSALGIGDEELLVGIVGRLVPIKDHNFLFQAMARVPDAHLAVIGDGELRANLEALASESALRGRVHFVGWRMDIPEVMADLDVIALSSRNEGTPVSLIEAAACARAVVATDVGGVRSVVTDGTTGLLVPHGDPDALAKAIASLLADDERRRTMGEAARTMVWRFDSGRLVADIQEVYEELLGIRR